jgi:uracil-DNA glycosylase
MRPELVLAVGGLSAKQLLGVSNLADCIGRRFELDDAVAIPLPHPSGTSRWLNDPANREQLAGALVVVSEELARLRTELPRSSP